MITRARPKLAALAALSVLVLIVVGLPVVLYRFGGSPLPGQIPSWPRIVTLLSSRDDGTVLLGIIRACSWLAWLLFAASVLAEAQAAIRGRRAPRLRLGGLQGVAAYLVALSALAFTAPSAVTLSASVTAASQLRDPGTGPPHSLVAASRMITVRSGDCLWSLAQRYLGAGDRYHEIADLNYGHEMSGGEVFRSPALIEPGWQLLLPVSTPVRAGLPSAVGHHLGHPTADPHYRRRHAAAANHSAQQIAGHQKGNRAAPDRPAPTSAVTAPDPNPAVGGNASLQPAIGNGGATGQASYPASTGANPGRALLPDATAFVTGALAGAVLTNLRRLRRRQRQYRRRGRRIALPSKKEALAAEQRLRAAAHAEQVETLRDALASLEASILRSGQELPDIVGLHVTPDVLEVLLATPAVDAPPAPFGISPGRQGMCWQLDLPATVTVPAGTSSANGRALAGLTCHLLPGLITAGATGSGYLLLDLESMQVTGCDGPPDLIDRVIATIATELATGQWSGWYDLILVGCRRLAPLGRAEHCTTVREAIDLLASRRAAAALRIAARTPAGVRELRLVEPDNEDWGLTVLVSRVEPTAEEMTHLLQLAEDGPGGIAALVAGDTESDDGRMAPAVIQLAPDPERPDGVIANIVPLQVTVRPRALSSAEYDSIGMLLAAAADPSDVSGDDEPYAAYNAPPWIRQAADLRPRPDAGSLPWADDGVVAEAPDQDLAYEGPPMSEHNSMSDHGFDVVDSPAPEHGWVPECELQEGTWTPEGSSQLPADASEQAVPSRLEIRILGPFAITGAAEQLQPKQAELVLALALATPAGLSNSALCSMLGADPDHPKPAEAVRQTITRTRRRLGRAGDGQEYIIHIGNGHYVLHKDAALDWTLFRELAAAGRADDLRAAVSLIRGQPFTGSYFWWIDIPLVETVRAEIVDVAETLAEFELAISSPRASGRAARAGLMAEPSAEQLWRAVMRAEHAAGNLAGVAEAWRRCLDAIEDIAPDGEPHPDTAALYRQLTETARQHIHAG